MLITPKNSFKSYTPNSEDISSAILLDAIIVFDSAIVFTVFPALNTIFELMEAKFFKTETVVSDNFITNPMFSNYYL